MNDITIIVSDGMPDALLKRQRERLAALELVRQALDDRKVVIARHHTGAPYLIGSELNVSISHDKQVIAVALSAQAGVGIDLQHPRPSMAKAVERVSTATEMRLTLPDALEKLGISRDMALWTAKEAVVKARADGEVTLGEVSVRAGMKTATLRGDTYALHYSTHGPAGICLAVKVESE